MKNFIEAAQYAFAALGGALGAVMGGFDGFLYALVVFVAVDYATGLMAAAVEKKLSSEVGFKGIFKKVIIFSLVAVGHIVDTHIIGEGSAVTLPQNNFCGLVSKNAIEERITAIMKSLFSAGFFPGLSHFLGAGFGTGLESPRASDSSNT